MQYIRKLFSHSSRIVNMTEGPVVSSVLAYAVPIMLSGILQLVFNAADTVVVGRFSGNEALAAVGSVGSLNNLIISLFIGFSIGVNVLVARYAGAEMHRELADTVHTSVLLSVVGGAALGLIGFAACRLLLELMGSPEDVIGLAVLYTRILFLGIPIQMLYNFCAAILRAVGDTQHPLYYLTAAGIINVFLNLIFVIVFGLGVAGVALATDISQVVSAFLIVRQLCRSEGDIRLDLRRLRFNTVIFRQIVAIGLPAGIQSSVFSLSNVVIQSSVNSFGSIVIAGNAAASNIGNFVYQAMNAFQQTITSYAGQNTGARKPERVIRSLWACQGWCILFGIVLGPLSCIFGHQLVGVFSPDEGVIQVGIERLWVVVAPYFLCGMMDVMTGVLRGIGYSFMPMAVSIMGACVFRIVWILTIFRFNHTMTCLLISYPVSWTLTFAVHTICFVLLWPKVRSRLTSPAA